MIKEIRIRSILLILSSSGGLPMAGFGPRNSFFIPFSSQGLHWRFGFQQTVVSY